MEKTLAIGQGLFYIAAGIWPVLDIKSFEKVTGPKKDDWLVKTVGLMIAASGAVILGSGLKRKQLPPETIALAAGHAVVLGGVSLFYGGTGRIAKIYLLDGLSEFAIVGLWTKAVASRREVPRLQKRSA